MKKIDKKGVLAFAIFVAFMLAVTVVGFFVIPLVFSNDVASNIIQFVWIAIMLRTFVGTIVLVRRNKR